MLYYGFDKIVRLVHTDKRCPKIRKNYQYLYHGHLERDLRTNTYEDLSEAMKDGYVKACPLCFKSGGNAFTIRINDHVEQYLLTDKELDALALMGDYMRANGEKEFSFGAAMADGKIKHKTNWYAAVGKLYKKGLVERKQYAISNRRKFKERIRCFTPYGAAVYEMHCYNRSVNSCPPPPQKEYKNLQ
jgi:hypothetical protein